MGLGRMLRLSWFEGCWAFDSIFLDLGLKIVRCAFIVLYQGF